MQCPAFVPQAVSIHLPIDSLFTKERQGLATAAGGPESPGCHPRLCGMNSDGTSQGSLDHGEQENLLGSDPVAIETSDSCSSQIWGWALREDFIAKGHTTAQARNSPRTTAQCKYRIEAAIQRGTLPNHSISREELLGKLPLSSSG